ncbi:MAG: hypothetical protein AAGA45_07545 [Verrucomicrobiota bacterium]
MFRGFYRWLYHRRQRRAAQRRLSGKLRPSSRFKRFKRAVFEREQLNKYDPPLLRIRKQLWILALPLGAFIGWLVYESIRGIALFQ